MESQDSAIRETEIDMNWNRKEEELKKNRSRSNKLDNKLCHDKMEQSRHLVIIFLSLSQVDECESRDSSTILPRRRRIVERSSKMDLGQNFYVQSFTTAAGPAKNYLFI